MSKLTKKVINKTGWKHKNYVTLSITESGGVSEKLKAGMIEFFRTFDYHMLVEEGGVGHSGHYHLHGVIGTNYKEVGNFRKKKIKPLYSKLGLETGHNGCRIKQVYELPGALSYAWKDKRILTHGGIHLNTILHWQVKPKKVNRLSKFIQVRNGDFVSTVIEYIELKGVKPPSEYNDVRNILKCMMDDRFLFNMDNKIRSNIGKILAVYGSTEYALAQLDDICNRYT